MTATDTSPVSVASYFVNMYFVGCLRLQIIRQASEKIKTGLGFDIVYADDVRSVITAFISCKHSEKYPK